jgi:hypothetical protein
MTRLLKFLRALWESLREASGENDYARYRSFVLTLGQEPMTLQAFYLTRWEHKYSRSSRCC